MCTFLVNRPQDDREHYNEDKTVYATSDEKYNHREDDSKKIMQDDKYVNEF